MSVIAASALRRKQGKAGKRSVVITGAQSDSGALSLDLFYNRHQVFLLSVFKSHLPLRLSQHRQIGDFVDRNFAADIRRLFRLIDRDTQARFGHAAVVIE
jgi:hypothetical protein